MAEVQHQESRTSRRRGRSSLPAPRIDMTPLVDLAFLLLTFFVLTAELSKQHAITTTFPIEGPKTEVNGMTIIIGKNPEKIFWYRGEFQPNMHLNETTLQKDHGLHKVLSDANRAVVENSNAIDRQYRLGLLRAAEWEKRRTEVLNSKAAPFVVVKWIGDASYGSVVDVIDELNQTCITKYAIVDASEAEKALVESTSNKK